MLTIDAFAKAYSMSSSSVRRHIRQGHLRSELRNGRRVIDPIEAERWLSEQRWRLRARNISRPDMPPVVLDQSDVLTLEFNNWLHIPLTKVWRVERLRAHGFQFDLIRRPRSLPYYRLKDIIEMEFGEWILQVGPNALGLRKLDQMRNPDSSELSCAADQ